MHICNKRVDGSWLIIEYPVVDTHAASYLWWMDCIKSVNPLASMYFPQLAFLTSNIWLALLFSFILKAV